MMPRARIVPPDEESAEPLARETLARVRDELGGTPCPLAELAAAPEALAGAWALLEGVLVRGRMPRTQKELALLAVASATGLVTLQGDLVRELGTRGLDAAVLEDLSVRGESSRLPDRTRRVVAFVRRAVLAPGDLEDRDFQALHRDGLEPRELAELVALAGACSFLATCARALGRAEPASTE